ncbi:MAG: LptA/OstA family protein [bacterium]
MRKYLFTDRIQKILWLGVICLCLIMAKYSYAAGGSTSGKGSTSTSINGNELTITADKAVWDKKQGITVLSGKVIVGKGKLSFTADTVEIIGQMDKIKEIKGTGNIIVNDSERNILVTADRIELSDWEKQITASGKVRITRGETAAEANMAVYQQGQQKIILTGEATINQDKSKLSGKKIIYYLGEERLEVIEGVRAWWKW